ncbi:MAG: hypothetical protein JNJ42_05890 [Burkholderiaceae bacterium]|jgi:hypothetical protein|nr:hypothetical protein [Burkholderiaceae bacterium]
MSSPNPRSWRRWAAWSATIGALVLVFAAYRNPHLMVDLANRLWACF